MTAPATTDLAPLVVAGPVTTSAELGALAGALAKAQGEIRAAEKDRANPFFNSSYATLASVWEACREPLSKNGLAVVQQPVNDGAKAGCVTTLLHASGQWMRSSLYATPEKSTPQALGSCITYVRRYALAAVAGVAPDDDDGNEASTKGNAREQFGPPKGGATREAPKVNSAPAASSVASGPNSSTQGSASPATTPTSAAKRPAANTVRHSGKLADAMQVKLIHTLRGKIGGLTVCTDKAPCEIGTSRACKYHQQLHAFKSPTGQPLTSSKDMSPEQADFLIDRYKAKIDQQAKTASQPIDIGGPVSAHERLAVAINAASANPGEYDDIKREACAPFNVDDIGELSVDQAKDALQLVLLRGDAEGYASKLAEIQS